MAIPPVKVLFLGQDKFSNVINKANAKLARFGKMTTQAGKRLTTAVSLPLALAGGAAIKMSTDFNSAMANVGTLIPGNQKRLEELKAGVQALAIETGKSTTDLAEGLFQVISAFGDTNETMAKLRTVARGAVAGVAETSDALRLSALVTKNYGDVTDKATQKVLNLAFKANELGQTTFPEMAQAMGPTIPIARTLGVTMEELFGVMGTFTGVTGNTSEVTTQLRSFLGALIKPTADMDKAFKKLGVSSGLELIKMRGLQGAMDDLVRITKPYPGVLGKVLGRKEALTLVLAATGELTDTFTEKQQKMMNVLGAADKAFKEQTQGINRAGFAMKQFQQRLVVLSQKFGDAFAPVLMDVLDMLTPLIKRFTSLSPATQKWVFIIGVAVAALGPLLIALGTLGTILPGLLIGIKALSVALMFLFANPIGLIILGIAAFLALVALWIFKFDKMIAFTKKWWWVLLMLGGPLGALMVIGTAIYSSWDKVTEVFKTAFEWISKVAKAIADFPLWGKIADLFTKKINPTITGKVEGPERPADWQAINSPWMQQQQLQNQKQVSKIDIQFANLPEGARIFSSDYGNLGEINRGFATAGVNQ